MSVTTRRHRIRNISLGLAAVLVGVTLPLSITKGNQVVGGNATLFGLWGAFAALMVVWVLSTDWAWPRLVAVRPYLPSVTAPQRRMRIRRGYDAEHARALVAAGRVGERLSQTFDIGEPEITPKSVAYRLGPKEASAAGPLVVATDRDAAIAKLEKWIKRGVAMEGGFPRTPTPDEIEGMSTEAKQTWIQALGVMGSDESFRIEEWHRGVVDDLRAIGGGAIRLFSVNEKMSQSWQRVPLNRAFLRERIEELQAIRARVDVGEQPENEGELFDELYPFRQRGLDILRRKDRGADQGLVDRVASEWIAGIRRLTEVHHPEFALHFMGTESGPDGQGQRIRELLQRLIFFLQNLVTLRITHARYGTGLKVLDVRDQLNGLIEDGRLNFVVDEETMGGDPAPGQEKRLILRWVQNGKDSDRSFHEGTFVGLPDTESDAGNREDPPLGLNHGGP